ncbi:metallophosphoesterase [Ruminococcaceae bacterium OttesenSCG-928-L11]|nr:metallophosphoesterase [Ruminococcaceae bacterium OttesenSCG-928-L11]
MDAFTFGLFADPQYGDKPMHINRFYRNAPDKLAACMELFKLANVEFTVCLGDLIDGENSPFLSEQACRRMQDIVEALERPCHYVLGNHDVNGVNRHRLMDLWGFPDQNGYYAFLHKGILCIVLDTNYDADDEPYMPGKGVWDHSYVSRDQLRWLKETLAATAARTVLVFSHALLDAGEDPHIVRNASAVRDILERSGKRIAVFQGHRHSGCASVTNGIPYHTLKGMVDTEATFFGLIVTVSDSGITAEVVSPMGRERISILP